MVAELKKIVGLSTCFTNVGMLAFTVSNKILNNTLKEDLFPFDFSM